MIVASDLNPFPEVQLPLGEALPPAHLSLHRARRGAFVPVMNQVRGGQGPDSPDSCLYQDSACTQHLLDCKLETLTGHSAPHAGGQGLRHIPRVTSIWP